MSTVIIDIQPDWSQADSANHSFVKNKPSLGTSSSHPSTDFALATSTPQWVKVTKTFSNFAAASLTNDISIYTLPIKGYIHDVKIVPTTPFSGGVISACTISVGIGGSLSKYAIATNVFTGNSTLGTIHAPLIGLESISGTTDIRAQMIGVGIAQTLNNLTAGSVDIYLLVSILP